MSLDAEYSDKQLMALVTKALEGDTNAYTCMMSIFNKYQQTERKMHFDISGMTASEVLQVEAAGQIIKQHVSDNNSKVDHL